MSWRSCRKSILSCLRQLLCCCSSFSLHLSTESRCLAFQGLQSPYKF
ncbi:secreted protein [gut metagenome]|uniref:Secreted protein n=1 Tax=gut metagenome TaxID=749906 RepID=J9GIA5_9ZZZZ